MINTEDYKKGFRDGFEYGKAKSNSEEKTSYWIADRIDKRHYHYRCHNCGCVLKYRKSNYCPDCGYKMEDYIYIIDKKEGET